MNHTIDLSDLHNEVMEHWNDNGVRWVTGSHHYSPSLPPEGMTEIEILPWAEEVLDDPLACVMELGFDSISQYIASKNEPETEKIGIDFGYGLITKTSTKLFFGSDLEMYLDRDPNTGMANLTIRAGYTNKADLEKLITELRRDFARAERVK